VADHDEFGTPSALLGDRCDGTRYRGLTAAPGVPLMLMPSFFGPWNRPRMMLPERAATCGPRRWGCVSCPRQRRVWPPRFGFFAVQRAFIPRGAGLCALAGLVWAIRCPAGLVGCRGGGCRGAVAVAAAGHGGAGGWRGLLRDRVKQGKLTFADQRNQHQARSFGQCFNRQRHRGVRLV